MSGETPDETSWFVSQNNHGRFKLVGVKGVYNKTGATGTDAIIASGQSQDFATRQHAISMGYFEYPVTLNPYDKEYILNVLGSKPYDGDAPIFVESLYDVALDQAIIEENVTKIDSALTQYNVYYTADYCHHEPVASLLRMSQTSLKRKHVGMRFLADAESKKLGIVVVPYDYKKN